MDSEKQNGIRIEVWARTDSKKREARMIKECSRSLFLPLLTVIFLLGGCTTFSELTEEDRSAHRPAEDEPILVRLKDGSRIEAEPYHHISVAESSDIVLGVGFRSKESGERPTPFKGKMERSSIDSCKEVKFKEEARFTCWLAGGSTVRFTKGNYLVITPDSVAGLYCIGTLTKGPFGRNYIDLEFAGRVPDEYVSQIEVQKFSTVNTLIIFTAVVATVYFVGVALVVSSL